MTPHALLTDPDQRWRDAEAWTIGRDMLSRGWYVTFGGLYLSKQGKLRYYVAYRNFFWETEIDALFFLTCWLAGVTNGYEQLGDACVSELNSIAQRWECN